MYVSTFVASWADRIVDDKVYSECIKEACSIFQTFVKNHGITLEIGNYNDLFHVLVWYYRNSTPLGNALSALDRWGINIQLQVGNFPDN